MNNGWYVLIFLVAIGLYANAIMVGDTTTDQAYWPSSTSDLYEWEHHLVNNEYRDPWMFQFQNVVGHQISKTMAVMAYGILCILLLSWLQHLAWLHPRWNLLLVLLFATHSTHSQALNGIEGPNDVFAALLIVGSLFSWSWWLKHQNWPVLVITVCCFFTTVIFKPSHLLLMALYPMFIALHRKGNDALLLGVMPTMLLLASLGFLWSTGGISQICTMNAWWMNWPQDLSVGEILGTGISTVGARILLLVFPFPLRYHQSMEVQSMDDLSTWMWLALVFLLVAAVVLLHRKNKANTAHWFIPLSLLILTLTADGLKVYRGELSMQENDLLLPSFALFWLLGSALSRVVARNAIAAKVIAVVAIVLASIFSIQTVDRNRDWRSPHALHTTDLAKLKTSAAAHFDLALVYRHKARSSTNEAARVTYNESAIRLLEQAHTLKSTPHYHQHLADAYMALQKWEGAVRSLAVLNAEAPMNTIHALNYSLVLIRTGQYQAALDCLNRVTLTSPAQAVKLERIRLRLAQAL